MLPVIQFRIEIKRCADHESEPADEETSPVHHHARKSFLDPNDPNLLLLIE